MLKFNFCNSIDEGTPIVSVDPGHKNILTCANFRFADENKTPLDFEKGYSLSLGEYYDKIGNKKMRRIIEKTKKYHKIDLIENEWSIHSLKTSNLETFKINLSTQLKGWNKISSFYRKTAHARMRFNCKQKEQRFIMKLVDRIAPDGKTIIAMGSAKFATNCMLEKAQF